MLHVPERPFGGALHRTTGQDHGLEKALDQTLLQLCEGALEDGRPVWLEMPVRNVNRTVGTMLGSEVTRRYGGAGLPEDTIRLHLTGSAGQSFGAFLPRGITLRLSGDANDYVGKGLSGGRIALVPPRELLETGFLAEENVVAGNVLLYGATAGELYVRGRVGERFAVRNSGAESVVEGVGDHACEYMTGGRVVVLGPTGRNVAAGMSGGIAYFLDNNADPLAGLRSRVNPEMVDVTELDEDGEQTVVRLLTRHAELTGSPLAERVLASWRGYRGLFLQVLPRDYKRVLEATHSAEVQGRNVDEAVMASAQAGAARG